MCELDHEEDWALKNWCFQIVVPENALQSPLGCKEIKLINPVEINPEYSFIGRTGAEAEAPILWPPYVKSQHIGKDTVAGKDWRQKKKVAAEFEMVS